MRVKLFKHGRQSGGGPAPYVSPYLLEILSTRPGAPAWTSATGSLVANTGQTVSCSRASSAYCLNDALQMVLLGSNTVRVEPDGLLNEGPSTNFVLNSNDFNDGNWVKDACTMTQDADATCLATGGTGLAWTWAGAAASTTVHRFYVPLNMGDTAAASFRVKKINLRYVTVSGYDGEIWYITVDLNDGSVVDQHQSTSAEVFAYSIKALADGWWDIRVGQKRTIGNNTYMLVYPADTLAHAVPETVWTSQTSDQMLFFGAQFEKLPLGTSYIPTTGAAATRAQDFVTVTNPLAALSQPVPQWSWSGTYAPLTTWAALRNTPHNAGQVGPMYFGPATFPSSNFANAYFDSRMVGTVVDAGGGNLLGYTNAYLSGSSPAVAAASWDNGTPTVQPPPTNTSGAGTGIVGTWDALATWGSVQTGVWPMWGHMHDLLIDNSILFP